MKVVFDSNILIDYLNGHVEAADELDRATSPIISRVTWIEVLAGARNDKDEAAIRSFLRLFEIQDIDKAIAEQAVQLRRQLRLRLPDATILATARTHECLLVTRNTRDFDRTLPDVRVPYRL